MATSGKRNDCVTPRAGDELHPKELLDRLADVLLDIWLEERTMDRTPMPHHGDTE